MSPIPRVVRNDWSTVPVPELADFTPSASVSVIIPGYRCQSTLDLTLAALSRQTYPTALLEVVVADDGSDPPLRLPELRPERTRLIRVPEFDPTGWGRANALYVAAAHSEGEILHWLDADMVPYPEHVAAQVRWQHQLPYAVTLGYKRFVDPEVHGPWPDPATVASRWDRGEPDQLFGGAAGDPHSYVERYINQTDQLRTADHLAFRIHVGATAALRRELYEAAGGFDRELRLGEDTEFGYRLAQVGAAFVPVPEARSWHLGRTQVMRAREQVDRYNRPFLADRIPYPRHWRRIGGPARTVPLVEVVLPVADQPVERVRAAVDSILRGAEPDVRVTLVGPWHRLTSGRVSPLADPLLDLRLIAAGYRGEPRVRCADAVPDTGFPAPYLLDLPAPVGFAPEAIRRLVELSDRHQVGAIEVGGQVGDTGRPVRWWRTAALHRARWQQPDRKLSWSTSPEHTWDEVASGFGVRVDTAATVGVADLTRYPPEELAAGVGDRVTGGTRPGLVPSTVEVEGIRSLARATVVVAWLGARRISGRLRRRRAR